MSHRTIATLGMIGALTGAVGVLGAALLLFWPPQVAPGPVSYPFTATGFDVAQVAFFVHHLGLAAICVGLAASAVGPRARLVQVGAVVAVAGMVGLSLAELNAIGYATRSFAVANAGVMGALYGITSTVIGAGLIVAGVGVVRARMWHGWHRWMPLVVGITEFVVLTPGLFGGFVIARLAIGVWMLLFGLLGLALFSENRRPSATESPVPTAAGASTR